MTVYLAEFSDTPERIYETLSVHRTEKGARKAIVDHRNNLKSSLAEYYPNIEESNWDKWKDWDITEIKLQN